MTQAPSKNDTPNELTRMEITISTLLRIGILASLTVVLTGVIIMFVHHPEYKHSRETLSYLKSADYKSPFTPASLIAGVKRVEGRSIVLLGVLVLFCTPLLRVMASVIAFACAKDWPFTIITLLVLGIVLFSLIAGRTE